MATSTILLPPILKALPAATPLSNTSPSHTHLLGHPISHSLSPTLHHSLTPPHLFNYTYTLLPSPTLTAAFIQTHLHQNEHFIGCSVTMPHKTEILKHIDFVTEEAAIVGAVNTVLVRHLEGRRVLVGANTDWIGIKAAIESALPQPPTLTGVGAAVVVGAGAAARAAVYALYCLNIRHILLLNRDTCEISALIDHSMFPNLHLTTTTTALPPNTCITTVVGCIPDMTPTTSSETGVRDTLFHILAQPQPHGGPRVCLDLCYTPRITAMLQKAHTEGWTCVDGLEVVIAQGIEQAVLWTGKPKHEMDIKQARANVRGVQEERERKERDSSRL